MRIGMGRLALFLIAWLVCSLAQADMPPPNARGCFKDRKQGKPCRTDQGEPGTCQPTTCDQYDAYSYDPPRSWVEECYLCITAEKAPAVAAAFAEWKRQERLSQIPYGLALGTALSLLVVGGSWIRSRRKSRLPAP